MQLQSMQQKNGYLFDKWRQCENGANLSTFYKTTAVYYRGKFQISAGRAL